MKELPVLISGASSGIGRACAVSLCKKGFRVFAGVRKESDGNILQKSASGKIVPLVFDVCDPISIKKAKDTVSNETGDQLFALINNAGVGLGGAVEALPVDEIRKLFEVNVIGVFAVTIAFIPLLREGTGGRIINMGSMSGILSLPGLSAYAASKHALEAITDSLRLELNPFNISVSIIEPGKVETPIWDKGLNSFNEAMNKSDSEVSGLYRHLNKQLIKYSLDSNGIPSDKVADLVHRILISKKPKNRYLLGKDAMFFKLISFLPAGIRDRIILAAMKI